MVSPAAVFFAESFGMMVEVFQPQNTAVDFVQRPKRPHTS